MAFDDGASDDDELRNRVLAEVEAVSITPEFERAPVMRRLLQFLVRTTLAGGGDELKAYSVAVDGLGRDPDFDSQSDSYPRVQVGRLRKMLDAYYASHPATGDVRLRIRTGAYRVHFAERPGGLGNGPDEAETPHAEAPSLRSLPLSMDRHPSWLRALTPARVAITSIGLIVLLSAIVLALSPSYRGAFLTDTQVEVEHAPVLELGAIDVAADPGAAAQGMQVRALLADALHRSWIVRIRDAGGQKGPMADGAGKPDYRLAGQIVKASDPGARVLYLWLWDAHSGNQLWSEHMVLPAENDGLAKLLAPVISTVIRSFGVIATQERARPMGTGALGYRCLLDYERYFRDRDPMLRLPVTRCITATIEAEPSNATALAAASFLAIDPTRGANTAATLERGAELARRAVGADPYSAEAQVADARVALVSGQCLRGTEAANRALLLNPYTPELNGLLGYLLYPCRDPRAETLMREARALDPDIPVFYDVALILSLVEHGAQDEAFEVAASLRPPGAGMAGQYALIQAIAAAARGDRGNAVRQWRQAADAAGAAPEAPDRVLRRFILSPLFRARVIAYLARSDVVPG